MPQLDPTWFASQLFWLLVCFGVLYAMLSRLVLPPLMDIMARRKQTIDGDIASAERLKTEAEQARQDYERTLANARSQAQKLLGDTMLAHKASAEQAGKNMDRQIAQKTAEAAKNIAAKKQELMAGLIPVAGELTSMITEKLAAHVPAKGQVNKVINELFKAE